MKRTYANAVTIAQQTVRAKMAASGRTKPTPADTAELKAMIARLVWLVPASEGGVMGLGDCQRAEWTSRHITIADVEAAAWDVGVWPADEVARVAA